MIIDGAIRRSQLIQRLWISGVLVGAFSGSAAHACTVLADPDCKTSPDSLGCHLIALLNLLYIAAGVLVAVLVVVIVVAVKAYRKNSRDDVGEV